MKICHQGFKRIVLAFVLVSVFFLSATGFAQEAAAEPENVAELSKTSTVEPEKNLKYQQGVLKRMNSARIKDAVFKHKSFLVAGGFWGFIVWILLLLNTVFFASAAGIAWVFIRRHRTYPKELVHRVKTVLYDGELGFAMEACSPCNTPLGRTLFSAFKNISDGFEVCKDEMNIALKAEHERMLKTTRLLLNCAIYSAVLGFLGSGLVLFYSLRVFAENARIGNFQELAFASSQAFYPLIAGLIVAYIAFWFHQYCLGKVNRIIINTEKIAYDLIKVLRGIRVEDDLPDLPTMTRLMNPRSIISLSKDKIVSKNNKDKK
jgi:biopolymer transport protein ExbB/TolQ